MRLVTYWERFFRRKHITPGCLETQLKRNLSTLDITLLGVGHMIGAGIYVLTGAVVRNTAGPSIVLSFLLAGFASLLSALCYAEFGARFPKAGSAYTYAYIGVGELWAFVIGWNIVLEHMLGAAAVARSWSAYLDSLLNNRIRNITENEFGVIDSTVFGEYLDFVAFLVVILVAIFVALGSKTSTMFNNIFTLINMVVITIVVGYGMSFADFSLWTGQTSSGDSKFFPYGFQGMLAGAASCFFAYIGFDGLATAGEEAKNPSRSIPLATFISMSIVTLAYILMSASLTLMIPYNVVHPSAAFADAFELKGATVARFAVSLGALCGMTTSLVGGMFALPRCVYAMAQDGLLFSFLAKVNDRTKVPVNAVIIFSLMVAVIALLFDIETLVEFLSIGTLLAYSIVSLCVMILRYQPAPIEGSPGKGLDHGGRVYNWVPMSSFINSLHAGQSIVWALIVMTISFFAIGLCFSTGFFKQGVLGAIVTGLALTISIFSFLLVAVHRQNRQQLAFKVHFVPVVPSLSLFINIQMMLHLAPITWLRLAVWMVIGMAIYLLYGIRHSAEERILAGARFTKSKTYETMSGHHNDDDDGGTVGTIGIEHFGEKDEKNVLPDRPSTSQSTSTGAYSNPVVDLEKIDST
ncbi:unnamed protein product, partial [Mesorhabditis belari]|uniref:Cationic amino acid transporter C-terminal domain-containing protein n=1 Tax=Mesorhabditis belari TaxID=2138241 RepID=A0AAF3ENB5_9BILA